MSNGRSNSSQTHAHWSVTIYEVVFEFYIIPQCFHEMFPVLDMTDF